MDDEQFRQIPEFMLYAVSNFGRVINIRFDRELTYSPTEYGDLTVGLMKNGRQWRRSVKVLVAKAWVPGESLVFDTVINKDADRHNNHYTNLAWRPRWFAWKYHKQYEIIPPWAFTGPIIDEATGYEYVDMVQAAALLGVMLGDIRQSISSGTRVFPLGCVFKYKY